MSGRTGGSIPLYSTPEFSLTVMGAPIISLRKVEGSEVSWGSDIFGLLFFLFGFSLVVICVWLPVVVVVVVVKAGDGEEGGRYV